MITTVTLNTSVDKLYLVDRFVPETVMRVRQVHNSAGGKGLNVTKVISLLGEPVTATGFIGGYSGQYIRSMLSRDGIRDDFVEVSGETRSCINILDAGSGKHTELLEPGQPVSAGDVARFIEKYREAVGRSTVVTISGSAPEGTSPDLYGELVRLAKEKGCRVILDASGPRLLHGIEAGPTMIKPNRDEIQYILGEKELSLSKLMHAIDSLQKKGIEVVAVSLGKEGVLVGEGGRFWKGTPPDLEAKNAVGCGDSMVAAFAVAFHRKMKTEDAVGFAVAVSAASALSWETGKLRPEDLEAVRPKVVVKQL